MNTTRNHPARAVAAIVLVAVVAGAAAVLAHGTVPARNGKIVFRMALGHPARLAVVNADGTGLRKLPHPPGVDDAHPDWSPDGSRIAFSRCRRRCAIFVIRPDRDGAHADRPKRRRSCVPGLVAER